MKKISENSKSKKLRTQALEQLCRTRAIINKNSPDLLDKVNEMVHAEGNAEMPVALEERLLIDKQKNVETVLKFIELKPHADHLKQALKKMLS